jgi:Tfp pilus assembly protein PilV
MKEIKNSKENKNNKTGFTLVETLIAIFILVLSVTGPMSVAQNSLKASFLARDQISAFYLAQDAIEYLKNEKDTNMIKKISDDTQEIFSSNYMTNCSIKPCAIDTTRSSSAVSTCPSGSCAPLCFDQVTQNYKTSGSSCSTLSKFTREVYMKNGESGEYIITVVIRWKSNFSLSDKKIVVQENIYNWLVTN